jgi:VCBS repeat-containing protein
MAISQAVELFNYINILRADKDEQNVLQITYHKTETPPGGQMSLQENDFHREGWPVPHVSTTKYYHWFEVNYDGIGKGGLEEGDQITVTGHSLGGPLAAVAIRLFPELLDQAVTFNAPGFDPNVGIAWGLPPQVDVGEKWTDEFMALFQDAVPGLNPADSFANLNSGTERLFTVESEGSSPGDDASVVSSELITGEAASPEIYVTTEMNSHSMDQLMDGLLIQSLIEQLNPSMTREEIGLLVQSASHVPGSSDEHLLYALSTLFLDKDDATSLPVGEAGLISAADFTEFRVPLEKRIVALEKAIDNNSSLNLLSLVDEPSEAIVAEAQQDNLSGMAYRYALLHLNSFAITGDESLYNPHNQNGELEIYNPATENGQLSNMYLTDRADMLSWKICHDVTDTDYGDEIEADISEDWDYTDLGMRDDDGNPLVLRIDGEGMEWTNHQIVFGSTDEDVVEGDSRSDRLYGMDGNDTLIGKGDDDYLEGGKGHDTYVIEDHDSVRDTGANTIRWRDGLSLGGTFSKVDATTWQQDAWDANGDYVQFILSFASGKAVLTQKGGTANSVTFLDQETPAGWNDAFGIHLDMTEPEPGQIIEGTSGDDELSGGSGNDMIYGYEGYDTLEGRDGNDWIWGGEDNDDINGGLGDDYIVSGDGNDFIEGDQANPWLHNYTIGGDDWIWGGEGDDYIHGGVGDDVVFGENGNDRLWGYQGENILSGGEGDDKLYTSSGEDSLYGGAGDDIFILKEDAVSDPYAVTTIYDAEKNDILEFREGPISFYFPDGMPFYLPYDIKQMSDTTWYGTIYEGSQSEKTFYFSLKQKDLHIYVFQNEYLGGKVIVKNYTNGDFKRTLPGFNSAPVSPLSVPDQQTVQGDGFLFTLPSGTFSDPEGDALTYSATLEDGSPLPAWLNFDPITQTFSGTPGNADVGGLALTIQATDPAGLSASRSFELTVANVNDAPQVGSAIGDQEAVPNEAFAFALPEDAFRDIDAGDTLTYTATLADGSALPEWLAFDPTAGTFYGTPAQNREYAIRITATDAAGASVSQVFALDVAAADITLHGDAGADTLLGGAGNDQLYGYEGDDQLSGAAGNDILMGGAGADILDGGDGNDTLTGGAGDDIIHSGGGDDSITFGPGAGHDGITDSGGMDTLVLADGLSPEDLWVERSGNDLLVALADGSSTTITDWDVADHKVEYIRFGDGTVMEMASLIVLQAKDYDVSLDEDSSLSGAIQLANPGDEVTFSVEQSAENGQFSVNADGTWNYTPAQDYNGRDHVLVKISNAAGEQTVSSIDFTIQPLNDAPVIEDTEEPYQLIGVMTHEGTVTASDVDGDALSYSVETSPQHGTLTVDDGGRWVYSAEDGYCGRDQAVITVADGQGDMAQTTLDFSINLFRAGDLVVDQNAPAGLLLEDAGRADLELVAEGDDLRITVADRGTVLLKGYFTHPQNSLQWLDTQDGRLDLAVDNVIHAEEAGIPFFGSWCQGDNSLDDLICGSAAADRLFGLGQSDVLFGGQGNDLLFGGRGNDTLVGGDGNDVLTGGRESDTLYGDRGSDRLFGGQGEDILSGGAGDDVLFGGADADLLSSGEGDDQLYGGAGDDVYSFHQGDGHDQVRDNGSWPWSDGGCDTVRFGEDIGVEDIAFYMHRGTLHMQYGEQDRVEIVRQNRNRSSIERFELADGSYLTDADVNQLIQQMAAFAADEGIAFSSLSDVRNNPELMTLVANAWHAG